ncbi:hypothetical protein O181_041609 [Austropuccinia psidii MF-1]|uniref:Integrase catalytic domain-containing protein n=1 Tax=Austropuccinia psidii MF-1 TaxID=1389203 RepID=A0A9Q3HGN3_9BASI|nr:hypothetical protein [Austropuccinia psidii MF-1]
MIKIQELSKPWDIVHMNWVTGLPKGGNTRYNSCLVIFYRFSKSPIFFSYHKDDTVIDIALLIWIRVVSWTGIFPNIISKRDLKCTSSLWKTLHQLFGTKLSFSTAYHPQADGPAARMIQKLEDMLAYKTSTHSSTNQTPDIIEKEWNPRLPQDSLRKDFVEIHPTAASFKGNIEKARKHAVRFVEDSFAYAKGKWEKSHATPEFKLGDLVLVSSTNFNNIKGCKKKKYSFSGPFL